MKTSKPFITSLVNTSVQTAESRNTSALRCPTTGSATRPPASHPAQRTPLNAPNTTERCPSGIESEARYLFLPSVPHVHFAPQSISTATGRGNLASQDEKEGRVGGVRGKRAACCPGPITIASPPPHTPAYCALASERHEVTQTPKF